MVASSNGSNKGRVTVRLPSGAHRNIPSTAFATKGLVASAVPLTRMLSGKAGRSR
jgi:ribosomal protein L2